MLHVTIDDISRPLGGPAQVLRDVLKEDVVQREIRRLGASAAEIEAAAAFLAASSLDIRAYQRLPRRMRRLVDLVDVAGLAALRPVASPAAERAAAI